MGRRAEEDGLAVRLANPLVQPHHVALDRPGREGEDEEADDVRDAEPDVEVRERAIALERCGHRDRRVTEGVLDGREEEEEHQRDAQHEVGGGQQDPLRVEAGFLMIEP